MQIKSGRLEADELVPRYHFVSTWAEAVLNLRSSICHCQGAASLACRSQLAAMGVNRHFCPCRPYSTCSEHDSSASLGQVPSAMCTCWADSPPMPLGGMRTVTTEARRPSSFVVYFKIVRTITAEHTSAMMATRSRIRYTELSTGVCSRS